MLPGYTRAWVSRKIAELTREGYPQAQAVAIALKEARTHFRARFGLRKLPAHLKGQAAKPNPVPASKRVQLRNAVKLYEDFTGHEGDVIARVEKPELPDVLLIVGEIDGILYSTTRDGKPEKYIHEFKKNSRPLFAVSHDGKQIVLLGGAYDFTERGIVDRTGR